MAGRHQAQLRLCQAQPGQRGVPKVDDLVWQFVRNRLEPDRLRVGLAALDALQTPDKRDDELARLDAQLKMLAGRLKILLRSVRGDEDEATLATFDTEIDGVKDEIARTSARQQALLSDEKIRATRQAERALMLEHIETARGQIDQADFELKRDILEIVETRVAVGHREGQKTLTIETAIAPTETIDIPRSWRCVRRVESPDG